MRTQTEATKEIQFKVGDVLVRDSKALVEGRDATRGIRRLQTRKLFYIVQRIVERNSGQRHATGLRIRHDGVTFGYDKFISIRPDGHPILMRLATLDELPGAIRERGA